MKNKNISELKYLKLCKKYSTHILQRIICPYCGHVYSSDESVDIAVMDDCEDETIINCKKCNKKILVVSSVTILRIFTKKVDTDADQKESEER